MAMRRTRKWAYVAQEAGRLAELGLSPKTIAARLSVSHSTVTRWMTVGKLKNTRRSRPGEGDVAPVSDRHPVEGWAIAMRQAYALDASDEELVTLGETALRLAYDTREPTATRLTAMARFQAVVKQLNLIARRGDELPAPDPEPRKAAPATPRVDPRRVLIQ